MPTKSIGELIACAEREAAWRRNTYPKWIVQGKLSEEEGAKELLCMEEIVEVLKFIAKLPHD